MPQYLGPIEVGRSEQLTPGENDLKVSEVLSERVGKQLLGELLTIVDASSGDKVQREALKSLVRQTLKKCMADLVCSVEIEHRKGEQSEKD